MTRAVMALAMAAVLSASVGAAQLALQKDLNGYTGYADAELQGFSVNTNTTNMWELKMGNCVT